jgi:hypothetical protein
MIMIDEGWWTGWDWNGDVGKSWCMFDFKNNGCNGDASSQYPIRVTGNPGHATSLTVCPQLKATKLRIQIFQSILLINLKIWI